MSAQNINYIEKIDIKALGWFWAASRGKHLEYYKENYYVPGDEKELEHYTCAKHLGQVIMFNFLSQRPDLIGMLIRGYIHNRMIIEHTVFGVDLLSFDKEPHDIYEYIWAAFKSHMFSIAEIMMLFDISDKEVRDKYKAFDEKFKKLEESNKNA